MNHPQTRARRGAHRIRRDLAGAVVPSLLAVASVAALVTALYVWRGEGPADQTAPVTSSGSPSPSSSTRSTDPAPSPADTSSTSPSASSPSASGPSSPSSSEEPRTRLEVVVLNQTSRSGLAATVAQDLRDQGFDVVATGNFRGVVPATTVYYPDGGRSGAQQVAEALPTEPRIRPRFSNLSTTRLTVVVTDSYPS